MNRQLLQTFAVIVISCCGAALSLAQESGKTSDKSSGKTSDKEAMEKRFSAMMKDATLDGTWVPVGQILGEKDKKDGYFIVEAKKVEGDKWVMVSRFNYKGQQLDLPVPVVIKFAGDTAVMILNDLPTGDGETWSARILFHNDVYAGSWWGTKTKKGGILSGVITRKGETKAKTE